MPLFVPLVVAGVLAASILPSQKLAPPAPAPVGPAVAGPTLPPQSPTVSWDPWPDSQTPVLLSGTVVIEGGGGSVFNAAIKRICGNLPHTVARTDARGHFSFQWNALSDVVPDASESTGFNGSPLAQSSVAGNQAPTTASPTRTNAGALPGVNMPGCELEADAPEYRSDRIELTGHRAMDNPDLGMIVLHRLARDPGLSVSATTLAASRDARKAWEKGVRLLRAEPIPDPAGAEREFERAVKIYPRYADAWVDLGRARQSLQKEDGAREAYLKAVDADDRRAEPFIGLGLIASRHRQWPEAARYLDRALQLDPEDYPHLWFDAAEADYHVWNLERAEKNLRQALKVDARIREPRAELLLGLVLLGKQDYAGAESALRRYLLASPDVEDWDEVNVKLEEIRAHLRGQL